MVKIEHCGKIRVFQMSTSYGCNSPAGNSVAMQKHGIILCKLKMQAARHHLCPVGPYLNLHSFCFAFLSELLSLSPSTVEGRGSWQGFFWIIQNVNRGEGIAIIFLE